MTETELRRAVIAAARRLGLLVHHCTAAERCIGKGLPDLIIVGPGGLAVAELKSEDGNTTESQDDWLRTLAIAGVHVYLWRPTSWTSGRIERVLNSLALG
jgi:hypothetical protein